MSERLSGSDRRALILDQASRLFAFHGLHGTTTKQIAKASGISEPVLYQHFKGKEEIYETLELMCSQQTAAFKKILRDLGPGIESLSTITYLLIRVISFHKEPGTASRPSDCPPAEILLRLMGYSFLENGRFARVLVENCIGAFFEQWLESYKKAAADGHLNFEKVEATQLWLAYESIIGMGMFLLPSSRLVDKISVAESGAKAATLFTLRGLGVKESSLNQRLNWNDLKKFYAKAIEESAPLNSSHA